MPRLPFEQRAETRARTFFLYPQALAKRSGQARKRGCRRPRPVPTALRSKFNISVLCDAISFVAWRRPSAAASQRLAAENRCKFKFIVTTIRPARDDRPIVTLPAQSDIRTPWPRDTDE